MFIDAADLFKRGRNQNTLEPEHAQAIYDAYLAWKDVPGSSKVATVADVEANGWNLNIPLYVAPADDGEKVTLADALADLETAVTAAAETRSALEAELAKWGLSA